MIKGCQHLKLYNTANSCERCLFPSLSLPLSHIFYFCASLFVDRTTRRQDCREFVPVVCVYLFVSQFGRGGGGGGGGEERRKPDGRNLSPPTQSPLC